MALLPDIATVFTAFRSLWLAIPSVPQMLMVFVVFIFILLSILKMTH